MSAQVVWNILHRYIDYEAQHNTHTIIWTVFVYGATDVAHDKSRSSVDRSIANT